MRKEKRKRVKSEEKMTSIANIFSTDGDFPREDTSEMILDESAEQQQHEEERARIEKQEEIYGLRYRELVVGMVLLGAVKEIHELEVLISLPNQLTGVLSIGDISKQLSARVQEYLDAEEEDQVSMPSLKDIFNEGQLLVCAVKSLTDENSGKKSVKKAINLTTIPESVNAGIDAVDLVKGMLVQGSVKSVEDHGIIVDLGFKKSFGFIKENEFEGELKEGSLVQAVVHEVSKRTVQLSMSSVSSFNCHYSSTIQSHCIQPGTLVEAKVTEVLSSGLIVKFFKLFEAHITGFEASLKVMNEKKISFADAHDLSQYFKVGQKILARVLVRYPSDEMNMHVTRKFALTVKPNLVAFSPHDFGALRRGIIVENAVVEGIEAKVGLYVKLGDDGLGFVHISRASDEELTSLDIKKFHIGTTHKGRVLGFDTLSGLTNISLEEKVLKATVFSYEDIKPGQLIKDAVIKRVDVDSKYVIVSLNSSSFDNIRAICPTLHLADVAVSNIEKRFKEGDKVKCRVLSVNAAERKVHVTMKKSLLNMTLPIVHELAEVKKILHNSSDLWSFGVVTGVKPIGIFVQFFGGVSGLVPRAEVHGGEDSEQWIKAYSLGQIVKCRIAGVNEKINRLRLSMKPGLAKALQVPNWFHVGLKAKAVVVESLVGGSGFVVEVRNGPETVKCFLPSYHMSDFPALNQLVADKIEIGAEIDVIVVTDGKRSMPNVSMKPLLLRENSQVSFPFSMDELKSNKVKVGFVRHVDAQFGVFVQFGAGLAGLCKKNQVSDVFMSDVNAKFTFGQTVFAVATEFFQDSKFAVSMKPSILSGYLSVDDLKKLQTESYFTSLARISTVDEQKKKSKLVADKIMDAKVSRIEDDEVIVTVGKETGHVLTSFFPQFAQPSELQTSDKLRLKFIGVIGCRNVFIQQEAAGPTNMTDMKIGQSVTVTVKSIKDNQVNVAIAPKVFGRIHVSQLKDFSIDDNIDSTKTIFDALQVKIGQQLQAKIIGFHDAKTHKTLAITQHHKRVVAELSLKTAEEPSREITDLKEGQVFIGFVQEVADTPTNYSMWLSINPWLTGRVPVMGTGLKADEFRLLKQKLKAGTPVKCAVYSIDSQNKKADFTLRVSPDNCLLKTAEDLKVGDKIPGKIVNVCKLKGISCLLFKYKDEPVFGRVALTDIADNFDEVDASKYKKNDFIDVCVIGVDAENKHVDLSVRASDITGAEVNVIDKRFYSVEDIESGSNVRGFIKSVSDAGLFVQLSTNITGRVKIAEISDEFIKDFKKDFKPGQLVKARITSVDDNRVELSMKLSVVDPEAFKKLHDDGKVTLDELESGMVMSGTVARVESFGVFVDLDNSWSGKGTRPLRGLCRNSELSDSPDFDTNAYSTGDRVKVIILEVKDARVKLGMKSSYFDDIIEVEDEVPDSEDEQMDDVEDVSADEREVIEEKSEDEDEDEDEDFVSDEETEPMEEDQNSLEPIDHDAQLKWTGTWQSLIPVDEADSADEEAHGEKKSRAVRKREKRDEEREIQKYEAKLAKGEIIQPETAQDFKRLLVGSPNSSYLWIQFIAFQLQISDLNAARATAEKALETINYREEAEKLNVWMAYLNMESRFGTEESFNQVFKRAIQYNEPKVIYMKMGQVYLKLDMFEKCELLFKSMLKKFSQSCKVWLQWITYWIARGRFDMAREIVEQAVKILPQRKRLKILLKFAQLEFKHGSRERGRTLFEQLTSNYPNRVDIWSIYLDKEIQGKDFHAIRRLFERCIHLSLNAKRIKFFFKKYLDFEKKHGDEITVAHVVQAAKDYVNAQRDA